MALSRCALLFVLASSANAAAVSRVSPDLNPESSEKFFNKDYPADNRPSPNGLDFSHPYPAVQASSAFSEDFVKDENSDNGQWKAQIEYDELRSKLKKEKAVAQKAYEKKEEEEKELEVAEEQEKAAEKKVEEVKKKAESAQEEVEKIKKGEVASADGKNADAKEKQIPAKVSEEGVKAATDNVSKEMDDLEKCKKELEEAKAKLKELMAKKESRGKR